MSDAHGSHGSSSFSDSALRAVSIIGLVAILVLGAWGVIQLVVGLPDFFASFGSHSTTQHQTATTTSEAVVITAPATVTSGEPFPLSWTHTGASTDNFTFSYACADGLS